MNWSPPNNRPDMAFSVEERYLALYGGWKHAADDEKEPSVGHRWDA